MNRKGEFKSIQVNLSRSKHEGIIEWLTELCNKEDRSLNSLIIQLIKKEYERCAEHATDAGKTKT